MWIKVAHNTPGTRGGPGSRDRTLAVKSQKNARKSVFLHLSSSCAKILGQKLFHTREFPRSGSKAKDGKEEKRKTESW